MPAGRQQQAAFIFILGPRKTTTTCRQAGETHLSQTNICSLNFRGSS